ncbi:MAG: cell wall-binding repeat-containing protein, partial [Erysipelotrichaceae bacterium]|nr:cell wall-binding repeat-containing protein [Erysipelotrichaceae bacterium]
MNLMFYGCGSLEELDISSFDTENVKKTGSMFASCGSLRSIHLGNLDLTKTVDMMRMFKGCTSLVSLDLGKISTSSDTLHYLDYMFSGCTSLLYLDISGINAERLNTMYGLFDECENLGSVVLGENFRKWLDEAYLPAGIWTHGELSKTETDLYKEYPSHAAEWAGEWKREDSTLPECGSPLIQNGPDYVFEFQSQFKDEPMKYTYSYDENWFFNDPSEYNHDLATMSLKMAMAGMADDETHMDDSHIVDLLHNMEFEDYLIKTSYPIPEDNSIGYAIGAKNINKDGNIISLITVTIRSGGYGQEWAGNFEIGNGQIHSGFDQAAEKVLEGLADYINEYSKYLLGDIKVWVSGYSRGAATANLLGVKLDDGRIASINPDDVFCYAFECPQNARSIRGRHEKYGNLFRIVNPNDFVTKVAPSYWTYSCYGVMKAIANPSNTNLTKYHNTLKPNMCEEYKKILAYNDIGNIDDAVYKVTYERFDQSGILNNLLDFISSLAYSPELYTDVHQEQIKRIVGKALADVDNPNMFKDCVYEIVMLVGGSAVISKLKDESSAEYIGKWIESIRDAVNMFVDDKNIQLEGHSFPAVFKAHYPELCLAWMESANTYRDTNSFNSGLLSASPVTLSESDTVGSETDEIFGSSTNRSVYISADSVPVINVYDENQNLLAHISSQDAERIENGLITYTDFNGQTVIEIPDDYDCTIEIEATQNGSLTYSCVENDYEIGDAVKVVSYIDVNADAGDSFIGLVEDISEYRDAGVYELLSDYVPLEPDISETGDEITRYTVSLDIQGDGAAIGSGVFFAGEHAGMHVIEGEERFLGWFDEDDVLLSAETEYDFAVKKDEHINAKFQESVPPVEEGSVIRLSGKLRYDTSLVVADELKSVLGIEKFDTVILATGEDFADALGGGYLAAKKSAPIILTKPTQKDKVNKYINENLTDNGTVYVLGGEGAVPASCLEGLNTSNIVRLSGRNRYV